MFNYNFNKNSIGCCLALFFIILLTQSKFFNVFIDTHLGRLILLILIIFISYINKFIGLTAILFIILALNKNNDYNIYDYTLYEGFNSVKTPQNNSNKNDNLKNKNKSIEGFCMTDRESNILKGKQSNTIPVFNSNKNEIDNVSPYENSFFTNDFSII
jgi:hypothetical protein